ncbi:MAG: ATP-binding cassette domain-containing protein [Pseudomonadota bacterium]
MSELVLNAIIHIFAILTHGLGEAFHPKAREIVRSYLEDYLGLGPAGGTYLGLFDDFLDLYQDAPREGLEENVRKIAARLAGRLPLAERYICLLRFFELTARARAAEMEAKKYIGGLAAEFNISKETTSELFLLCFHPDDQAHFSDRFGVLNAKSVTGGGQGRVISRPDFDGRLTVLHVEEIDAFFVIRLEGGPILLDGALLAPGRVHGLGPGAILHDRQWRSIYYSEIVAPFKSLARDLTLEGLDLNYRFPGNDNGLHDFSFSVSSGELTAVMGVSGAGKSTLLNILNGSLPPDSGRLLINGENAAGVPDRLEGVIGYIPQDDLLFEDLTVYENLRYSARLCLADLTDEELGRRVEETLKELGQYEIRDLKVGSPLEKTISGGQRKRLNIALELIREPALLFVDEPTSGLSSSDSEIVMSLLKAQALKGRLVVVVIHQPSSAIFKMFDRLWILDQGGYPIYDGNPLEAVVYFRAAVQQAGMEEYACQRCGTVNPDQIFSIIEAKTIDDHGQFTTSRKISPLEWHRRYLDKRGAARPAYDHGSGLIDKKLCRPSLPGQFKIFLERNFKARLANSNYLLVNLLEPLALALFIGGLTRGLSGKEYVFRENMNVSIFFFMSVIVSLFLGLSVSAEEINGDRKVLSRERFLHLSWMGYIGAKTVYLALVCAVQMAIYTAAANTLVQAPDMYAKTWLVLFSCGLVSCLLGLNISAAFQRTVTIYILIPLLLIPQMLLCGLVIDFDDLISRRAEERLVPWYAEFIPSRWGLEALLVEQYTSNRYMRTMLDDEMLRRRKEYYHQYHIPEMAALSDYVFLPDRPRDFEEQARINLETLRLETRVLEKESLLNSGFDDSAFTLENFNRESWKKFGKFLGKAEAAILAEQRKAETGVDKAENEIDSRLGVSGRQEIKNRHTNISIERLALGLGRLDLVRRAGGRIVQLVYPVAQVPSSNLGRAHFMSRVKVINGFHLNAFAFNVCVLGLIGLALFLSLYCNLGPRTWKAAVEAVKKCKSAVRPGLF